MSVHASPSSIAPSKLPSNASSLTADRDNQRLAGGLEADAIAEAHLDADAIVAGVQQFAPDRPKRAARQRSLLDAPHGP